MAPTTMKSESNQILKTLETKKAKLLSQLESLEKSIKIVSLKDHKAKLFSQLESLEKSIKILSGNKKSEASSAEWHSTGYAENKFSLIR